jgi:7-carboxy-7-deazaguanine synthase
VNAATDDTALVAPAPRLRITETFVSLQGEADAVGWPTFFIRLTGCPLRCTYCDTTYAFHGGEWRDVDTLVRAALESGVRHVCVTGGEPLAQPRVLLLLERLCDAGLAVSLETAGSHDIGPVDPRVTRVVDVKTPGSGETARNRLENLALLAARDQLKFVIVDRADYDWSREFLRAHDVAARCTVLFSPGHGSLHPAELAGWILADRLPVRFQLQLHKVLWGEAPGR